MDEKREVHVATTAVPSHDFETQPRTSTTSARRTLHQSRPYWQQQLLFGVDVLLALAPLAFLGIAIAAIAYNGVAVSEDRVRSVYIVKPVNMTVSGGGAVVEAANIAVSLFPIVFAAIVGRFMKAYALHRAEKGSEMGILEQLYGSQNLSNAVQLAFALGGLNLLGVAAVVLWVLSPIGGQGIKRVMYSDTSPSYVDALVYYTNTSGSSSAYANHFDRVIRGKYTKDILTAAFATHQLGNQSDVWSNVKIPYLKSLNQTGLIPAYTGYPEGVYYNLTGAKSSSMVGIQVNNATTQNHTGVYASLTSSYIDMNCKSAQKFFFNSSQPVNPNITDDQPYTITAGITDFATWAGPLLTTALTNESDPTQLPDFLNPLSSTLSHFFVDVKSITVNVSTDGEPNVQKTTFEVPPVFVFASIDANLSESEPSDDGTYNSYWGGIINAFECPSEVVWTTASIDCENGLPCYVDTIGRVERPNATTFDSIFQTVDNDNDHGLPLANLLSLVNGYDTYVSDDLGAPQRYIAGIQNVADGTSDTSVDMSQVPVEQISYGLSSLLNTAWLIGVQYTSLISQTVISNATLLNMSDPNSNTYDGVPVIGHDVIPTDGLFWIATPIYKANWAWIVVAFLVSTGLVVMGAFATYFRHKNQHPDVLGFVSTLARDNPAFEPPAEAEKYDGLELAAYYKHARVQLVNTADLDEPTRITLKPQRGVNRRGSV